MSAGQPGHVLLVAPNRSGDTAGNEVTVQRHARLLRERGVTVEILRPDDDLADAPHHLSAEIVHAYHARRCGPRAVWLDGLLKVPLVVSITGTDLSLDLAREDRCRVVTNVLKRASAVLCGHSDEADVVRHLAPRTAHVGVIPKSVVTPETLPAPAFPRRPGEFVVLVVANVRPVKRLDVAVRAVAGLRAEGSPVRLVVVGRVLDAAEDERIVELCGGAAAWEAIRHPAVPHHAMGGLYAAADVVLNTSDAEGGSNAVLEAMAHGRAVVASDVPGNAALVGRDGAHGLLYPTARDPGGAVTHDVVALVWTLHGLAVDRALRERLGSAAREHVRAHHGEQAEAAALLSAYAAVIS